jgi:hypothetical protein
VTEAPDPLTGKALDDLPPILAKRIRKMRRIKAAREVGLGDWRLNPVWQPWNNEVEREQHYAD